jgi:hypothetical protein
VGGGPGRPISQSRRRAKIRTVSPYSGVWREINGMSSYQTQKSSEAKRGRPRTADADRPVTLTVRVSPQLYDHVYKSARTAPSLSAYVRASLRRA